MEYSELIGRILTAEHSARLLAREAREKKESLETSLKQESDSLRTAYLDQARRQVEALERGERERTRQALETLDKRWKSAQAEMEEALALHGEQWADSLFQRMIGDGPWQKY